MRTKEVEKGWRVKRLGEMGWGELKIWVETGEEADVRKV